ENTIIFFFSDHGGCLPRGKAFTYETGFRSALMVYTPKKWEHLLPAHSGEHSSRIVEFADFGPTLLSIAGVQPPDHMQGKAFMGKYATKERDAAFCFRTNTGPHFDPSRSVLNGKYQYIKNYTPYKLHALKQSFQWGMPAQTAWDSLFYVGKCAPEHEQYYKAKPMEQLFDSEKDPFGLSNLATDPEYSAILKKTRSRLAQHINETDDAGFLPKEVRDSLSRINLSLYNYVKQEQYPLNELHLLAEQASQLNIKDQSVFLNSLSHSKVEFRFWAASGLANHAYHGLLKTIPDELRRAANDRSKCVQATAAEAMIYAGQENEGIMVLLEQAQQGNELALSSMENLGDRLVPYIMELKNLAESSQKGEIRFMTRGILFNQGQLKRSELFEQKAIDSFVRNHKKRLKDRAPTRP
ncbi:MAG: sulfatase-like hydrolase/transferase, partial [Bacteroidales bacterium]|nr:sulfatase-like hydrolase/transferase [Bacteroidales bacterium]